jgi:NDP-sugar pyrophosphorylase family protein
LISNDAVIIQPNVVILQNTTIGNNVVISAGVVIASEGFGNALDKQGHWHAIAHLGNVLNDIITNCNALLNCRVCTYGTIFANNNGFGNGATIGNVFTVNLSTNMDAIGEKRSTNLYCK